MKKTKFLAGLMLVLGLMLFLPTVPAKAYTLHDSQDKVWMYEILTPSTIELQGINSSKYREIYGSISNVTFPSIVDGYQVTSISLFQYGLPSDTQSVTLPEGITNIESFFLGFADRKMLHTVNLPASLTTIGNQTFADFSSLSAVNFAPNSQLTTIEMLAFLNTTSLNSFDFMQFSKLSSIGSSAFSGSFINTVSLGDNISLAYHVFGNCPALTSFSIGKNSKLAHNIFEDCHNLTDASFGDNAYLSFNIFKNCENLSSLDLGKVKSLGSNLFTTTKIKKLVIPRSCTSMPSAYKGSYNLVPKNVVLYVDKGSVSENYAKKIGYKYKYNSGTTTKVGKVSSLKVSKKSTSSIKVSWKKVSGANGYQVYMKTNSGSYKKAATIKKGSTASCTIKKLKKNKTYTFKVRAYKNVSKKMVYGSYSSTKKLKLK